MSRNGGRGGGMARGRRRALMVPMALAALGAGTGVWMTPVLAQSPPPGHASGPEGWRAGQPLRACASEQPFPPYTYVLPGNPRPQGLGVQLLQQLVKEAAGVPLSIELMPLERCLQRLAQGHYQLAMDVPAMRVDPLRFYATQPYAQVATVYVYARDAHPEGLGVNRLADLRRLKVCVLRGFPLEEDMVDARQVDDQSTSLEQLFGKVQQGRCDAALEREDVVDHLAQGQASLARWVRQMRLKAEKVPQDSAVRYHVVVSRQMPGSERLQGMLDARLRRLHQQGLLPLKPGTPVQEMP